MRAVPVYVMRVSGLRLRLAGGFAAAFAVGLALLAAFGIAYLKRESTRRFDVRLDSVVGEVIAELRREETEYPDSSLTFVASRVATEWSDTNDAFVIFDVAGTAIGAYDPHHLSQRIREALAASPDAVRLSLIQTDPHLRVRIVDAAPFQRALQSGARVHIVTFGSSEGIEQDSQLLGVLFAVSAPLIVLISLAAGYVLAGRALKPVRDLANAMSAIAPTDLNHRLAAGTPQR